MQCYDAFSFVTPQPDSSSSNDDNEDKYSVTFVSVLTVGLSLFTLLLGFGLGYFYLKYQIAGSVSELSKPLLNILENSKSHHPEQMI